MSDMETDSPFDFSSSAPRDRIIQRLAQHGVPLEEHDPVQLGLIGHVVHNKSQIPELVCVILPTDEEMTDAIRALKPNSRNTSVDSKLRDVLGECMVWLQWLMFNSEPRLALKELSEKTVGQRGVCGAVWGSNDIAYRCRTCEHDQTCSICVLCFQNGNHRGHDYSIIYTGGGCCDCGDATAWKREGFCVNHRGAEHIQPLSEKYANSVGPVLDALFIWWKSKLMFAKNLVNTPGGGDHAELSLVANTLTSVVVEMLLEFFKCSESLLSFVSNRISSSVDLLGLFVSAESFLVNDALLKLHELLLKLLGEPIFKYEFAKIFVDYYPSVVNEIVKANIYDIFKQRPLLSTFSVQILTVPTLAPRLVEEMNLMEVLLGCLNNILVSCAGDDSRLEINKLTHFLNITHRILEDIRTVLSHDVVLRNITHNRHDILRTWMKLLAFLQGTDPQKRETGIHVEEENESTYSYFIIVRSVAEINLLLSDGLLSVCGVHEMCSEAHLDIYNQDLDVEDSARQAKVGQISQNSSACGASGNNLQSDMVPYPLIPSQFIWVVNECLRTIEDWLGVDRIFHSVLSPDINRASGSNFLALKPTLSIFRKGLSAPAFSGSMGLHNGKCFSSFIDRHRSVVVNNKPSTEQACESIIDGSNAERGPTIKFNAFRLFSISVWPEVIYDISLQDVSVHIPLHRFLSLLLQKSVENYYGKCSPSNSCSASSSSPLHWNFFRHVLGGCHPYGFSAFLMEHPIQIRAFCAQVRAGMWRRNGDSALLSRGLYLSPPWKDLELDLFLLQFCAAVAPPDAYVSRILSCFGLTSYLSLNLEHSSEYEPVLMQEMLVLLIQIVKERQFCGLTRAQRLKRDLIHRLSIGDATHSQLLKFLPRDLSKADQFNEILASVAQYSNPSGLNQGVYSLRRSYWEELDLFHPHWNPKDLQIAEERFIRFRNISPFSCLLPKWTKIFDPLKGVARIVTCKMVLQIIRSVLYYAVMTDNTSTSRAPDRVFVTSLHLLALALDVCSLHIHSSELPWDTGDAIPMLAFAGENVSEGLNNRSDDHNLLSLLVSLMRLCKNEDPADCLEVGRCNLSSFIECLLSKFAELDSGCMTQLQKLAPDVFKHSTQSPASDAYGVWFASGVETRKAKARERQAAVMEKIKADQSKFLASIGPTSDGGSISSTSGQEEFQSDVGHDPEDSIQDICSLCHDPDPGNPLSYLIFLQKSRLLTFAGRGPSSWEHAYHPDRGARITSSGSSSTPPSYQNVVNDFAGSGQHAKANTFLDLVRTYCLAVENNMQFCNSSNKEEGTARSFLTLEDDMYFSIRRQMHCDPSIVEDYQSSPAPVLSLKCNMEAEFLGRYVGTVSSVNSEFSSNCKDREPSDVTTTDSIYDGFGPSDADGIHISSCGHVVHQGCLNHYLSSLKERYGRQIAFEGGRFVDLNKGEFLCPVCRRLANSVLPALPVGFLKARMQPNVSSVSSQLLAGSLASLNEGTHRLCLQQALSLLKSAANVITKDNKVNAFSTWRNGSISPLFEPLFHVLHEIYFTGKHELQPRNGHPVFIWDTLKYSLISMEIAARSEKTCLIPTYDHYKLYEGFKSSNGLVLSFLLRIVQHMCRENGAYGLQRFCGIQLFWESIGRHGEFAASACGGVTSYALKDDEMDVEYPDTQFWKRASDPILSHDPFSSLMWVLYSLPYPFLSCEESFLCLVHLFYVVSVVQVVIAYCSKYQCKVSELGLHNCLVADISEVIGGGVQQYFVFNYMDPFSNLTDLIRSLSFPYLRRCALLWKLVNLSASASTLVPDKISGVTVELSEPEKLEAMFRIPPLDIVLKDEVLRSLALKWFWHFCKEFDHASQFVLYLAPAAPFKLIQLPLVYQDLLERYIKWQGPGCEPTLCLLCGRLCSACLKSCCREIGTRSHSMVCGVDIGVFLLIRKTMILLQRSGHLAFWPSPYLDAFGEEDDGMRRGKPLYLNKERYAALAQMVASHELHWSSKVPSSTTGGFFHTLF